jgi:TetR/AcrR family fatty acid metabolism transcriptional regulator
MGKISDLVEKEYKRRKILNAALKIFSRKGYGTAAIDEVAQEAGIAKGTLYLYFRDKEDLFCSTILYFVDNFAEYLKKHVDGNAGPVDILKSIAYHELRFFSQNSDFFGIFRIFIHENIVCKHEELFKILMEKKKQLLNYEIELVERGRKEGIFRRDISTEDIVVCFDGMLTNTIHQFGSICAFAPPKDVDVKVLSLMKIFMHGILEKGRSSEA